MTPLTHLVTYAERMSRLASDIATDCRDHAALHRDIGFPQVAGAYRLGAERQATAAAMAERIATVGRAGVAA